MTKTYRVRCRLALTLLIIAALTPLGSTYGASGLGDAQIQGGTSLYGRLTAQEARNLAMQSVAISIMGHKQRSGGEVWRFGLDLRYASVKYPVGGATKSGVYLAAGLGAGTTWQLPVWALKLHVTASYLPYSRMATASSATSDVNGRAVRYANITAYTGRQGFVLGATALRPLKFSSFGVPVDMQYGLGSDLLLQVFDHVANRTSTSDPALRPDNSETAAPLPYKMLVFSLSLVLGFKI